MQSDIGFAPFQEPIGRTLARNFAIAAAVGALFALRARSFAHFAPASALALFFSLGGHYVEILFLNVLRPRLARDRLVQVAGRLATWFAGGVLLYLLMSVTARLLPVRPPSFANCWFGGPLFIGVELVVHFGLALRRLPNFYAGNG